MGAGAGLAGVFALLVAGSQALAGFNYVDFTSTAGLNLEGAATITSDTIAVTPSVDHAAGAVWYAASKQNVAGGFQTDFKIRVFDRQGGGADGMAFVIQNTSATAIGGAGGAIGYADNIWYGQTGIPNSLAVELDLWNNTNRGWNDFGDLARHVSVQTRGTLTNSPDESASLGAAGIDDLGDGQVHSIRVVYAGGMMRIFVDDMVNAKLAIAVDLATVLALDSGSAWVGITAATGGAPDREGHELRSWSFNNEVPAPTSAALLGLGGLAACRRRRA